MEDEKQLSVELEYQPLAHPAQARHLSALELHRRRLDRAHHERIAEAEALERLPDNPRRQSFEIDDDVR